MGSPSDSDLLLDFAASHSESAFRELVARHLDHVHSVARRVTRNAELAEDVSQQVFARLAARPRSVSRGVSLAAWLHTTTRSLAIDLVRSEEARRRRESAYQHHADMNKPETSDWSHLEPVIDEVVESLPPVDREIILQRFYRKNSHAEVGRRLNLGEDAARMRTNRALEKLRSRLAKRGITTTAAALALALPAHAVTTAPAGLASGISTTALAAAAAATGGSSLATLIAMTKSHLAALAAIAIAVPIITLQHSRNTQLEHTVEDLRVQATTMADASPSATAHDPVRATGRNTPGDKTAPASLREILALGDPLNRMRALLAYIDRLPADQLGAALDELRAGSPDWDPEAKIFLHLLLTRWAKEDPDAAFASLNDLDFKKRGGEATSILASLAALDPERAARWLQDPENALVYFPKMGHVLAGTIAKEWVRQDPSAALAWARDLPEEQRAGAYGGLLGTLAGTDPEAAASMAANLEPGDSRLHAIGEIATAWTKQSPQAALAWARTLEGPDRQTALGQALGAWAQTDPSAAATYLDGLAASEGIDRYLRPVAASWAIRNPVDAVEWVSAQSDGDGKNEAMGHVLWNWTTLDPEAASTWLAEQPTGPSTDSAIGGLAKAAFDSDPPGAIIWATRLSDPGQRERAVEIGLHEWLRRDPKAATDWAHQTGVTLPSSSKIEH